MSEDSPELPFLLNPRNREAAAGDLSRLDSGSGRPGCMVFFMIPFLLAGLALAGGAIHEGVRHWRLAQDGVLTRAVVVERHSEPGEDDHLYWLTYRYEAPAPGRDGQARAPLRWVHEESVRSETYFAHDPGAALTVRYWRQDPTVAEIDRRGRGPVLPLLLAGFALVWNALVWLAFRAFAREAWLFRLLRRRGTRLAGRIVHCDTARDSDGDWVVRIDYQFDSPAGRLLVGRQSGTLATGSGLPDPPPAPGRAVWVAYLDDARHRLL